MEGNTGGGFTQGISTAVGASVTLEIGTMLINPTRQPVTVENVHVIRLDPALRFDGWRLDKPIVSGGRSTLMANTTPFPPTTPGVQTSPVVGPSRTRNSDGRLIGDVAVAFGVTMLKAGSYEASGVQVDYRNTSGTHRVTLCTTCRFDFHTP